MPVSTVLVMIAVVAMFALFSIALAWAQLQTRHLTIGMSSPKADDLPKRRPF
jgi:hypothetical protein